MDYKNKLSKKILSNHMKAMGKVAAQIMYEAFCKAYKIKIKN